MHYEIGMCWTFDTSDRRLCWVDESCGATCPSRQSALHRCDHISASITSRAWTKSLAKIHLRATSTGECRACLLLCRILDPSFSPLLLNLHPDFPLFCFQQGTSHSSSSASVNSLISTFQFYSFLFFSS